MIKKYFLFGLFFTLWSVSFSQEKNYEFNSNCERIYKNLLNLQLDSAQFYLNIENKVNPNNLLPVLLSNYHDFLKIVLEEDKKLFEELSNQKKERLYQWKQGSKKSPWYLAGQAQIKLQWAFARVLFDEYFTAATEINSAYHLLEENKIEHPDFLADNMGIGILHAMIGVVPDQYRWAMEMFGLYGTIDQGLNEIQVQLVSKPEHPYSQEALFYYTFARLNLDNDSSRLTEILDYYKSEPYRSFSESSPLLHFSKAVVLLKKDNTVAIEILKTSPKPSGITFHYPVFLLGQAYLYQLNPQADDFLNQYINSYSGRNYKKTALQRLAWSRFIQGDTTSYLEYMNRILLESSGILDSDKSAEKEAKAAHDAELPNLNLLRSRLQFDGLYYPGALNELDKIHIQDLNSDTRLEYYYRRGRILHEMYDLTEAIKAYRKALKEGRDSNRYFAGNAALKLGEIYESQKQFEEARQFYGICLDLDFTEYRRGIRAKAKAGLQRVEASLE